MYDSRIMGFGTDGRQTPLLMMYMLIAAGVVHVGVGLGPETFSEGQRAHGAKDITR